MQLRIFGRIPPVTLSIVLAIILLGSSPSTALYIPSQPDILFSHLRRIRSLPGSLSTAPEGAVGENPPPAVPDSSSGAARLIRDGPQLGVVLVLLLVVALIMRWMYGFVKRHKATMPSHGKLENLP